MADASLLPRAVVALIAAELCVLLGPVPLRVAGGLMLVLALPGLGLIRAIRLRPSLDGPEQLLLVVGMSVAITVLTGITMDALELRLTRTNWAIALGLLAAVGLVAARLLRRGELAGAAKRRGTGLIFVRYGTSAPGTGPNFIRHRRSAPGTGPNFIRHGTSAPGTGPNFIRHGTPAPGEARGPSGAAAAAGMLVLAVLAVAGALVIAVGGDRYRGPGFTELWALPQPLPSAGVRVGVRSHERRHVRYLLTVTIDRRVATRREVMLRPGQAWQSTQRVTRAGREVDITLRTLPWGWIYRSVHVTTGA